LISLDEPGVVSIRSLAGHDEVIITERKIQSDIGHVAEMDRPLHRTRHGMLYKGKIIENAEPSVSSSPKNSGAQFLSEAPKAPFWKRAKMHWNEMKFTGLWSSHGGSDKQAFSSCCGAPGFPPLCTRFTSTTRESTGARFCWLGANWKSRKCSAGLREEDERAQEAATAMPRPIPATLHRRRQTEIRSPHRRAGAEPKVIATQARLIRSACSREPITFPGNRLASGRAKSGEMFAGSASISAKRRQDAEISSRGDGKRPPHEGTGDHRENPITSPMKVRPHSHRPVKKLSGASCRFTAPDTPLVSLKKSRRSPRPLANNKH